MKGVANINQIKNNYILKQLFAYTHYKNILNLLKNSKKLQKRLGINIDNYKNILDYPRYEYIKKKKLKQIFPFHSPAQSILMIYKWHIFLGTILSLPYSLVYSILLVSLKGFNNNNTIQNYNKSSFNFIKNINACLFVYDALNLGSIFILNKKFLINFYDYGKLKIIKSLTMIVIIISYILFEGLVVGKLVLSYKIKKNKITWFMIMDYIFLFINFIYIIIYLSIACHFFHYLSKYLRFTISYTLISFNGIKIKENELPDDFLKLRQKYILENSNNFEIFISDKQKELINLINDLRERNNINKLIIDENIILTDSILENNTEIIFFEEKNIFKLYNKQYLFIYPIGEFEKKIKNGNKEIINILLKDNLFYIQIYNKYKKEYIFIFEESNKFKPKKIALDSFEKILLNNNINSDNNLETSFDVQVIQRENFIE